VFLTLSEVEWGKPAFFLIAVAVAVAAAFAFAFVFVLRRHPERSEGPLYFVVVAALAFLVVIPEG
jgi:hypothetical protein